MCASNDVPAYDRADSEWLPASDFTCDQCLGLHGPLYAFDKRMVCAKCAVRLSGHPACDYCDRPTFGDYRRIDGKVISIACGVCMDKWAERYERGAA